MKSARLPALKSRTGFDYSSVKFPQDYRREALASLEFINHAQDLVPYGDVGTGKTHMAAALVAAACQQGIQARIFTTSCLVMALRRAKDEGRLDKELTSIAKNQLLVIDLCRAGNYAEVPRTLAAERALLLGSGEESAVAISA
ncbi:ATP-binding protein [Arthrobacter sp. H35-D1]|nr:ATP-binding protein [Arthrobacter sp. H35-D1]MDJ0313891.1 ATP-binding protein [Arthrobacter sp. H35-D1]